MQSLFRKILKGHYPRVSKIYSKDLIYLVKNMLQTKSIDRPSCEELLQMPVVSSRALKMTPYIFKQYSGSVGQGFAYNNKISQNFKKGTNQLLKSIYLPKLDDNEDLN
jgi:hypothetical protein